MDPVLLDRLRQTLDLVQQSEAEALRLAVALRHGGGTEEELAQARMGYEVLRCERTRLLREWMRWQESQDGPARRDC